MNMMLLYQELSALLLVEPCVGEHTDLVSDVVPCSYIIRNVPGVFIYSNLFLSASLMEMILFATSLSSSFHCCKFYGLDSTRSAILAPWIGGLE